jgi:hypothetical protein
MKSLKLLCHALTKLKQSRAVVWTLILVAVLCGQSQIAECAAQKGKTAEGTSGATKPDAKKQIEEFKKFQGKLVTIFDPANPDTGDYISCKFTVKELMDLRPVPEVVFLSAFDEEQLKSKVIAEALSQANEGAFDKGQEVSFAKAISSASLEGKTPSQALETIIDRLNQVTEPSPDVKKLTTAAENSSRALMDTDALGVSSWTGPLKSQFNSAHVTGNTAAERLHSLNMELEKIQPSDPISSATLADVKTKVQAAEANVTATGPQAVVNTARTTTSAFQRPDDIACAMSILDWNTTRYGFGVTVADQYIAVQIVVRNLNPNLEFLVHDAELAVDTDLNGRHGSFFSGIDKMTVRGFSLASRNYGRRNLVVNMAQGVGTILSAVMPIYGDAVKDASSVYNSGFLQSLTNVWKDSNTDQLNLLNDFGFSASKTDRTVVPKSSTAMFVIFVESKPLQQVWWAQPCANALVLSKSGENGAQSGVDMEASKAICLDEAEGTASVKSGQTDINYIREPKSVHYKDWSPRAKEIFRELTFTVIAGTHVIEEKDTNPALTKIDCPLDAKGDVDLSKAENGKLSCALTGTNLDKIASLRLRNSQAQQDTKTADGTVKGDSAVFTSNDLCALEKPAYNVFVETKDGVETGGAQRLNLDLNPKLTDDPNPGQMALDQLSVKGAKSVNVKLKGCHLDNVTAVHLETGNHIKMDTTKPLTNQTAAGLSFDVTAEMVAKAKIPAGDYTSPNELKFDISLITKDSKAGIGTGKNLQGAGKVPVAGARAAAVPH